MRSFLALVVVVTGTAHTAEQESHGHSGAHMVSPASPPSPEGMIPSLAGATTWINTAPIPPQELRGKVVLIDFWTYTCINWRRTVPSLRAWFERYGKSGLLLIGAHSPEFPFEKDLDNVRPVHQGTGRRVAGRGRQRLLDLARVRERVLAGALHLRCEGSPPAPDIR
jgi:hypothetical protein